MRHLLDTHVLLYWLGGDPRLSPARRRVIECAGQASPLWLSDISLWEIATLASLGRVRLHLPLGEWLLRADVSNPLMFDHPNDHMPAMVLLDAAQQAAHLTFGPRPFRPFSCVVSCSRYVEFDAPCTVRTDLTEETDGGWTLSVTGHQGAGFLTGLICNKPAAQIQKTLLADHNILTGTSGDPNVLRLLPPFTLKEAEVDLLAAALKRL